MAVHCGAEMEAEEGGRGWRVLTKCPVGIGPGMEPMELLAKCVRCPVARRARKKREKEAKDG